MGMVSGMFNPQNRYVAGRIVRCLGPLLSVSVAMVGCKKQSEVVCTVPVTNADSSCSPDQNCTLDIRGLAACRVPGPVLEGQACDWGAYGDDEGPCGEELACVLSFGQWRCLRLCSTEGVDTCYGRELKSWGCRAAFVGQPDLGVCLPKCDLNGDVDECPAGTDCTVPFGVGFPTCATVGDEPEGAECSAESKCAAGLICTPTVGGARCRRPRGDGCGPLQYVHCLHGTPLVESGDEETSEAPHRVCTPCRPTGLEHIDGRAVVVCDAAATCEAEGGDLARPEDGQALTPLRVGGAVDRVFPSSPATAGPACREDEGHPSAIEVQGARVRELGLVVAADLTADGWWWRSLDGDEERCETAPVNDRLFAPDAPRTGRCLVLRTNGFLEASEACAGPVLCAVGPPTACVER